MDQGAEAKRKPATILLWTLIAVVVVVFVIPLKTVEGTAVTRHYTLWNLLTGNGASSGEVRVYERNTDPYPR